LKVFNVCQIAAVDSMIDAVSPSEVTLTFSRMERWSHEW